MSTAARGGKSDGVECKEGESPGNETSKPWKLSGGDDLIAGDDLIPREVLDGGGFPVSFGRRRKHLTGC